MVWIGFVTSALLAPLVLGHPQGHGGPHVATRQGETEWRFSPRFDRRSTVRASPSVRGAGRRSGAIVRNTGLAASVGACPIRAAVRDPARSRDHRRHVHHAVVITDLAERAWC